MSTLYGTTTTCTACGAELAVQIADSLNANRMPKAREWILERSLFSTTCPCGQRMTAITPVLYVDFERGLWVQTAPETDRPRFRDVEHEALAAYRDAFDTGKFPAFVAVLRDQVRPRVAFGYEELREKVVGADAGLDDTLVEILKLEILAAQPHLIRQGVSLLTLDGVDDAGLHFLMFRFGAAGGEIVGDLTLAHAGYDSARLRSEALRRTYPGLFQGLYVNVQRYRFEPASSVAAS